MGLFRRLKKRQEHETHEPESEVIVKVDDAGVYCHRPGRPTESVSWKELGAVLIETTDAGPFLTDVFWILVGKDSGCVIPIGAAGEQRLLEELQKLPDFDNEAVVAAMSSAKNQKWLCWKREEGT